jgi:hypothetical protein
MRFIRKDAVICLYQKTESILEVLLLANLQLLKLRRFIPNLMVAIIVVGIVILVSWFYLIDLLSSLK